MEPKEQTLVASTTHPGMLALDRENGHVLHTGTLIAAQFEDGWLDGLVVQHERHDGCYCLGAMRGPMRELVPGMKIKLL